MGGGPQQRVELARGAKLGTFSLGEKIARGGMAEIWTAYSPAFAEPVALKILLSQYTNDPTFRAMFHDEMNIATRLDHENIARVHGGYEDNGHLYCAMDLLDGSDLRRVLSRVAQNEERVPIGVALAIVRGVAAGLAYAHTKTYEDGRPMEIVHRDVSPHNVILTRAGVVKVLDFGIARAAERLTRTRTGIIKGKVSYMAPEQALAVGVTPQTDIFAAGILLWEMLAMRRLFRAPSEAESLELVVRADVPDVRALNPDVPEPLAELSRRMLAQRAPDRPASMAEVMDRIDAIVGALDDGAYDRDALAAWTVDTLDVDRAETQMLPADAADKTLPTPAVDGADFFQMATEEGPIEPEVADVLADRGDPTDPSTPPDPSGPTGEIEAMDDPTDETPHVNRDEIEDPSGPTGENEAPSAPTEAIRAVNVPTMEIQRPARMSSKPSEPGEKKVRLPSRSEIVRAVDAQETVPVRADPAFIAALPQVEVKTPPGATPVASSSSTPSGPFISSSPAMELHAVDPASTPPSIEADDMGSFEPLAPTGTRENTPAPAAPERTTPTGSFPWMPVLTAFLAIVVVVLVVVLLFRG